MPYHQAIQKFHDQLIAAGVSDQAAAFTSGKISSSILEEVMQHVEATVGEAELAQLENLEVAEQAKKIEEIYQQKTGQTVGEYRDQLAEKKLAEFEAAAAGE